MAMQPAEDWESLPRVIAHLLFDSWSDDNFIGLRGAPAAPPPPKRIAREPRSRKYAINSSNRNGRTDGLDVYSSSESSSEDRTDSDRSSDSSGEERRRNATSDGSSLEHRPRRQRSDKGSNKDKPVKSRVSLLNLLKKAFHSVEPSEMKPSDIEPNVERMKAQENATQRLEQDYEFTLRMSELLKRAESSQVRREQEDA